MSTDKKRPASKTIIRSAPRSHWTTVNNELAQDRNLSFEARGMMLYLLSQPEDWILQPTDLQQRCGRDKVYAVLKELIAARYIVREWLLDEAKHRIGIAYIVHENPFTENPFTEKPDTENPHITNDVEEQKTNDDSTNHHARKKRTPLKTTECPDPLFGVVARHLFGVDPGRAYAARKTRDYYRMHVRKLVDAEKYHLHVEDLTAVQYNALADEFPGFVAWYKHDHPTLDLPRNGKFEAWIDQWYEAGKPNPAKAKHIRRIYDPACPKCHGTGQYEAGVNALGEPTIAFCDCLREVDDAA